MARVLFISNCQHWPMSIAWKMLRPEDQIASYEVHTVIGNDVEMAGALRRIELADIILANPIDRSYPVPFATTEFLKDIAAHKTLIVPMFYFTGLQPDMTYVGGPQTRVSSPMGEYHSRIVLRAFLEGASWREALRRFSSEEEYAIRGYREMWESSLAELGRRDLLCDVSGVDAVQALIRETRTFWTINHPTNALMMEMIRRALDALSLRPEVTRPPHMPPTLDSGPVWPIFPVLEEWHGLRGLADQTLKSGYFRQVVLSFQEFVAKSYYIYAGSSNLAKTNPVIEMLELIGIQRDDFEDYLRSVSRRAEGIVRLLPVPSSFDALGELLSSAWADSEAENFVIDALWKQPTNEAVLNGYVEHLLRDASIDDFFSFVKATAAFDAGALEAACKALMAKARFDEALEIAERWIIERPSDAKAWKALRDLKRQRGELDAAIFCAEQINRLTPDDLSNARLTAHILADMGETGLAVAQIELVLRRWGPNAHDLALAGLLNMRLGNLHDAERRYSEACILAPEVDAFRGMLGQVRQSLAST